MAFFKKRQPEDTITPFWSWWGAEGRALAEQSIDGRLDPQDFARTMSERVQSLGELAWALSAGETSQHVLVISPENDPALRPLARRVVLAAPDADATWSYADSRPPVPDLDSVALGPVDLAQVRVSARLNDGRFDVQVHHPAFADMSEEDRGQVTMLALDAALGEVDTELWLGEVQPVEHPPLDGFGLLALRSVVRDLKGQRLDADGQPQWLMLQGDTPNGPLQALVRSPLHPLLAPNLDTYLGLTVPYPVTDDGLPDADVLEELRALEHRITGRLGNEGQVVAHLSAAGVRTLHLYVDSTAGLVPRVTEVARAWPHGKVDVYEMPDPGWSAVAHLRQ